MKAKSQAVIMIVAALFVLFSAMWDPRVSVGVAVVVLLMLCIAFRMWRSHPLFPSRHV